MVVYRTDSNGSSHYDATPKSVPTARRYPASPFSSWFSQGLTTHNISTVIAVVLFSILLFQYYSYDNSCELEQSGLRGLWREKKMEYENDMRRWEQERAANENQAKLDRRVKEMELESVTMRWEQERAASESQARLDWSAEEMKHERERERWELERTANRTQGRSDWDKEKLAHQNVREGWERERQKLAAENERVKEKWERERREREAQDKRAREKSVRDQWERDSEAKRAKEQWAKERQQWKAERKGWEKERAKYLPYFEEPILKDTHCRAFNTREYQARLWNIRLPGDNRWLEACMSTETTIRGQKFKSPHRCVDQGMGMIMAYWTVTDPKETGCSSTWGTLQDNGCFGGTHVYKAPLLGHRPGDDWYKMCRTTLGEKDLGFTSGCVQQPQGASSTPLRTVGIWELNDPTCQ